jgi:hypothetical protein
MVISLPRIGPRIGLFALPTFLDFVPEFISPPVRDISVAPDRGGVMGDCVPIGLLGWVNGGDDDWMGGILG